MLTQKLNQINSTLNDLIKITQEDIKNIKKANHFEVFKNISIKEEKAELFSRLKSEIDEILIKRNKPIEEIFTKEEEILFDVFRDKLTTFHELHKKFSKLAFSVYNFYNALLSELKEEEPKIDYSNTKIPKSHLTLKA